MAKTGLSYRDAGVDIEAGNQLVERIKGVAKATRRPGVMSGLGGFGALFDLSQTDYQEPILVSGTDGVGTKLKIAFDCQRHDTIGIDLVAMCVNDLLVQGAEPLFFLDYYATGKLSIDTAAAVVTGISAGCEQAGCALIGGETAEMPGLYQGEDYDLAGFCVGVVEKSRLIDGSQIQAGDSIIALASSGAHSNGYSLIRKILAINNIDISQPQHRDLANTLLAPTKIYVKPILEVLKTHAVHGLAHITGGGLLENIPRVLPDNCVAKIDANSWQWPELFTWLQKHGQVSQEDMYLTFNCGVGMVLIAPAEQTAAIIAALNAIGETAWQIGTIQTRTDDAAILID